MRPSKNSLSPKFIHNFISWFPGFNATDVEVLNAIGFAKEPISPYELKDIIDKSYNVIHKSVKKLYERRLINLDEIQSEKSGKKTIYSLNFLGFGIFYIYICGEWGISDVVNFQEVIISKERMDSLIGFFSQYSNLDPIFEYIAEYSSHSNEKNSEKVLSALIFILRDAFASIIFSHTSKFKPENPKSINELFRDELVESITAIIGCDFFYPENLKRAITVLTEDLLLNQKYSQGILLNILESIESIQFISSFLQERTSQKINEIEWDQLKEVIKSSIIEFE